jgi:hypothetical protein
MELFKNGDFRTLYYISRIKEPATLFLLPWIFFIALFAVADPGSGSQIMQTILGMIAKK